MKVTSPALRTIDSLAEVLDKKTAKYRTEDQQNIGQQNTVLKNLTFRTWLGTACSWREDGKILVMRTADYYIGRRQSCGQGDMNIRRRKTEH